MEEWIGRAWDRFITARSGAGHPEAAVRLADLERTLAVYYRALGGNAAVRLAPAATHRTGARRRLLSRIAGTADRTAAAMVGTEALRLPAQVAVFADRELNRELYLWLAALAAHLPDDGDSWILANQRAALRTLTRWPGLQSRYRRLIAAALDLRPQPDTLPADEAAQERAVRAALVSPGSVPDLPPLRRRGAHALAPVPLWLHQARTGAGVRARQGAAGSQDSCADANAPPRTLETERVAAPDSQSPFNLPFRAESLLSWADFIRVNRPTDDSESTHSAAPDCIERMALAEYTAPAAASRLRFDLDLPGAAADDIALSDGLLLPEWDFRRRLLRPDYCRLQPMTARASVPTALPPQLRRTARRLRSQFAALAPARRWRSAAPEGTELDLEALVRHRADRMLGRAVAAGNLYRAQARCERDLSCLLLADLSLSTDAWLSDSHRVIDVIRDSLMLFGEALTATADEFSMYGFSSLKRSLVRFHVIKEFDEALSPAVRGRIAALRPGYYTRLGAAVRQATRLLQQRSAALRILLILTDGKPHDIDHYDGRYGIEDTRASVLEARRAGLRPFCVTIDREGAGYLPHVFGHGGYVVLRRPEDLPARLPLLYAQLTG